MERLVFGPEEVRISEEHGKGINYVRDNFCRWKGPLAYRSGWQQSSDCVTRSAICKANSSLYEPVISLLPNSDCQAGIIGLVGVMAAILKHEK